MRSALLLILLAAGMQACYYDNEKDLYPVVPGTGCDTVALSYSADIKPIIDSRCVACHGSNFPSGNLSLTNHAQVAGSVASIINRINRPAGDPLLMPQGNKLDACSIQKIEAWANQGAPNN